MSTPFSIALTREVLSNLFNDYSDNTDTYRFGNKVQQAEAGGLKSAVRKQLNSRGYYSVPQTIDGALKRIDRSAEMIGHFEFLYNLLEDDYSRKFLVKVCAFRIFGNRKVKLPMNHPGFWSAVRNIEKNNRDENDFIVSGFVGDLKLYKHNLESLGYPAKIYLRSPGVYYDFVYHCYSYSQNGVSIKVEPGDHVVDAGACYGDTAILFGHDAGSTGVVHSFEFVPENLEILEKNLSLNPGIGSRVKIHRQPIWSAVGVPVYFEVAGPGTRVSMEPISSKSTVVETATLDQLVEQKKIERIDFMKMDIEGAETEALKGAEQSIRKFKPRLAISLYHRESDFREIPRFIHNLGLGYRFYFNHYTMHAEESVLFCIAK